MNGFMFKKIFAFFLFLLSNKSNKNFSIITAVKSPNIKNVFELLIKSESKVKEPFVKNEFKHIARTYDNPIRINPIINFQIPFIIFPQNYNK